MPELRPYQQEAVAAVMTNWADGMPRPAVVLPCGAGKTVIFTELARRMIRHADRRPVILVNRDELVRQTVRKMWDADPTLSVGVIQGRRDESRNTDVVVASIQTIGRQARLDRLDLNRFNLLIADECHYAASDSWRRTMDHFGAFKADSGCLSVGFTATMTRTDKRGLGEIWSEVVFSRDTRWAIDQEFLVPVRAQMVTIPGLDTDKIKTRNGDLADGDLGRAMAQAEAGPLIVNAYLEHGRDEIGELRRGIVFSPTVDVAQSFLADFHRAGVPCELILGSTPTVERQASYERVRAGTSKLLVTVMVCSVGFDLPAVEVAIMARPTKSRGLYQQQVGRVLRLSPETGKTDALILDVVGVAGHGLASIVDLGLDEPVSESGPVELDELGPDRIAQPKPLAPTEIGFVEVDPFSVQRMASAKPRNRWSITHGGVPFLPRTADFLSTIFIHRDPNGSWSVGQKPRDGRAIRVGSGFTLEEARSVALALHPGMPSKLYGPPTPRQIQLLATEGVDVAEVRTKQDASEMLNVIFASRELDVRR